MGIFRLLTRLRSQNHYLPVLAQQATYLQHASSALCEMTETIDKNKWKKLEKEVKACEVQGDALLTEFHELLYEAILRRVRRIDIQTIAMNIDDFLDHMNDSAKSIPLYMPKRIDSQIADLAQYIHAQADAIKKMMYPLIFRPILYLGYKARCKKYFASNKELKKKANKMVKDTVKNYRIKYKMKVKSVIKMYREFGLTVF